MGAVALVIVAVIAGGGVLAAITTMIVGSIRSTRGGADWAATRDTGFLPWDDQETEDLERWRDD